MAEKLSPSGKLIVDQDGAVTTITLNRPRVHNALDQEISAELNAAVKDVAVDRDCRVLILRGAGDTFCAGDDIKGFLDFAPDDGPWNIRMYQETVNIIDNLVPVTIAGVDGVCTGGGLELTLVCDFVIATHRSRWGMPEINWGITPGWGRHRATEQVRRTAQGQRMEPARLPVQRRGRRTLRPGQPSVRARGPR